MSIVFQARILVHRYRYLFEYLFVRVSTLPDTYSQPGIWIIRSNILMLAGGKVKRGGWAAAQPPRSGTRSDPIADCAR